MTSQQVHRRRAVVVGLGAYLPERRDDERGSGRHGRDLGRMDRPADRHSPAPHRGRAADETTSALGLRAAEAALADAQLRGSDLDLVIVATSTARLHVPGRRHPDPGSPRHDERRGLRPAGRMLGLRLRGRDGGKIPDVRVASARPRHRRGDVFAAARLGGPHDLRPLRRWRGRDRARGARERRARRARRPDDASTLGRAPS